MSFFNCKTCTGFILLLLSTVLLTTGYANDVSVHNKPGDYLSTKGQCMAFLQVSDLGGFIELSVFITNKKSEKLITVNDITGIAWLDNSNLIYSVSSLYGKSGIYKFNCLNQEHKPVRIIAPKIYNKYFPDGADYFELNSVVGNRIFYYYGKDVENINFNKFRINSNLRNYIIDPSISKDS